MHPDFTRGRVEEGNPAPILSNSVKVKMANYKTDERPLKSGVYIDVRMILLNSFIVEIKKENV